MAIGISVGVSIGMSIGVAIGMAIGFPCDVLARVLNSYDLLETSELLCSNLMISLGCLSSRAHSL